MPYVKREGSPKIKSEPGDSRNATTAAIQDTPIEVLTKMANITAYIPETSYSSRLGFSPGYRARTSETGRNVSFKEKDSEIGYASPPQSSPSDECWYLSPSPMDLDDDIQSINPSPRPHSTTSRTMTNTQDPPQRLLCVVGKIPKGCEELVERLRAKPGDKALLEQLRARGYKAIVDPPRTRTRDRCWCVTCGGDFNKGPACAAVTVRARFGDGGDNSHNWAKVAMAQ